MPILIRYVPTSLTREQYDKVNEILQEMAPAGPLNHSNCTSCSVRGRTFESVRSGNQRPRGSKPGTAA